MRRFNWVCATVLAAVIGSLSACAQTAPRDGNTPATTPPATTTPAPRPEPQLGPDGYGDLKIGMTKTEAVATGLTTEVDVTMPAACGGPGDGYLAGVPVPHATTIAGKLFFSHNTERLVAIYAYPGVSTPQGIGPGSSYDDVHAVYPDWSAIGPDPTSGRGGISVPGNPDAAYRIVVLNGQVTEISLDSHQDCYE